MRRTLGSRVSGVVGRRRDPTSLWRAIFRPPRSLSRPRHIREYRATVTDMPVARFLRLYGDWALAIGLAALLQIEVWTIDPSHPPGDVGGDVYSSGERAAAAAAGLLLTVSLGWRRRAPLLVLAVGIATSVVATAVPLLDAATTPAVALVVAAYSVGAHANGLRAVIGVAGVGALIAANAAADFSAGNVLFIAMILGGAWLAGRAMQYRRERERALERLTVDLEREREEKARAAVAEERVRIARELHDVVAHAISVIVLQARGGRRSLAADPEETREALDTIEATGSAALAEMRRLLGMLRTDDEEIALAPQPSLRYLDALAAQVRDAGLPVEVSIEGQPVELPPGVDLSAYRIVQEALTNALRHAGPATARVVVRYGDHDVELEIADTGVGVGPADGAGHGLVGMRERVSLYGGKIEAGPRDGGGFAVRARLPLDSERL
jgi:signal transduction histidine kinase